LRENDSPVGVAEWLYREWTITTSIPNAKNVGSSGGFGRGGPGDGSGSVDRNVQDR